MVYRTPQCHSLRSAGGAGQRTCAGFSSELRKGRSPRRRATGAQRRRPGSERHWARRWFIARPNVTGRLGGLHAVASRQGERRRAVGEPAGRASRTGSRSRQIVGKAVVRGHRFCVGDPRLRSLAVSKDEQRRGDLVGEVSELGRLRAVQPRLDRAGLIERLERCVESPARALNAPSGGALVGSAASFFSRSARARSRSLRSASRTAAAAA